MIASIALALATSVLHLLAVPASASPADFSPNPATTLQKRFDRPTVFFCHGELPPNFAFTALHRPWPDMRLWQRDQFSHLTQLCNFENVGCYCQRPRLWGLLGGGPWINCEHPVKGREELNEGQPGGPAMSSFAMSMSGFRIPGFRKYCEDHCFCQNQRPEFLETVVTGLGSSRENTEDAWRGSVRDPPLLPGRPAKDKGAPPAQAEAKADSSSDEAKSSSDADAFNSLLPGPPVQTQPLTGDPLDRAPMAEPPAQPLVAGTPSNDQAASGGLSCPRTPCWRAGSCSGTSQCPCVVYPQDRCPSAPPRGQRPPARGALPAPIATQRLRTVCGATSRVGMAFKRQICSRDAADWKPLDQRELPAALENLPDDPRNEKSEPDSSGEVGKRERVLLPAPLIQDPLSGTLCPCNCTFISDQCCTPEAIAQRGVIPLPAVSFGVVDLPQSMCCNAQTGDLQQLPAGQELVGNTTLCP